MNSNNQQVFPESHQQITYNQILQHHPPAHCASSNSSPCKRLKPIVPDAPFEPNVRRKEVQIQTSNRSREPSIPQLKISDMVKQERKQMNESNLTPIMHMSSSMCHFLKDNKENILRTADSHHSLEQLQEQQMMVAPTDGSECLRAHYSPMVKNPQFRQQQIAAEAPGKKCTFEISNEGFLLNHQNSGLHQQMSGGFSHMNDVFPMEPCRKLGTVFISQQQSTNSLNSPDIYNNSIKTINDNNNQYSAQDSQTLFELTDNLQRELANQRSEDCYHQHFKQPSASKDLLFLQELIRENRVLKSQLNESASHPITEAVSSPTFMQNKPQSSQHEHENLLQLSQSNVMSQANINDTQMLYNKYLNNQSEQHWNSEFAHPTSIQPAYLGDLPSQSTIFEYTQDNQKLQEGGKMNQNQYLSAELDDLRVKLRQVEQMHQRSLAQAEQCLLEKDSYVKKLERKLKDMSRHYNQTQHELQEQLHFKALEVEESKRGLQQLVKVVNEHKHLILEDIIHHVNIFEQTQQSDVYVLLKIIFEILFKKLHKFKKEAKHGPHTQAQTPTSKQPAITNETSHKLAQQDQLHGHSVSTSASSVNCKEPHQIEAELNDCHKKLKDLEKLIQSNKTPTKNSNDCPCNKPHDKSPMQHLRKRSTSANRTMPCPKSVSRDRQTREDQLQHQMLLKNQTFLNQDLPLEQSTLKSFFPNSSLNRSRDVLRTTANKDSLKSAIPDLKQPLQTNEWNPLGQSYDQPRKEEVIMKMKHFVKSPQRGRTEHSHFSSCRNSGGKRSRKRQSSVSPNATAKPAPHSFNQFLQAGPFSPMQQQLLLAFNEGLKNATSLSTPQTPYRQ